MRYYGYKWRESQCEEITKHVVKHVLGVKVSSDYRDEKAIQDERNQWKKYFNFIDFDSLIKDFPINSLEKLNNAKPEDYLKCSNYQIYKLYYEKANKNILSNNTKVYFWSNKKGDSFSLNFIADDNLTTCLKKKKKDYRISSCFVKYSWDKSYMIPFLSNLSKDDFAKKFVVNKTNDSELIDSIYSAYKKLYDNYQHDNAHIVRMYKLPNSDIGRDFNKMDLCLCTLFEYISPSFSSSESVDQIVQSMPKQFNPCMFLNKVQRRYEIHSEVDIPKYDQFTDDNASNFLNEFGSKLDENEFFSLLYSSLLAVKKVDLKINVSKEQKEYVDFVNDLVDRLNKEN